MPAFNLAKVWAPSVMRPAAAKASNLKYMQQQFLKTDLPTSIHALELCIVEWKAVFLPPLKGVGF
jgi:hypothetical protein